MKRDSLHDGRADGLSPLESLDLNQVRTFADLLRAMSKTAFGGRQLGEAFEIVLEMARRPECRVVLTLSGAMTVAKQGRIICDMIDPFVDLQQYARFAGTAECLGIFTVGGGVPRNWAQQVAPYYDVASYRLNIELPAPRFHYGVRICPEPVHWGGMSGCTSTFDSLLPTSVGSSRAP